MYDDLTDVIKPNTIQPNTIQYNLTLPYTIHHNTVGVHEPWPKHWPLKFTDTSSSRSLISPWGKKVLTFFSKFNPLSADTPLIRRLSIALSVSVLTWFVCSYQLHGKIPKFRLEKKQIVRAMPLGKLQRMINVLWFEKIQFNLSTFFSLFRWFR